MANLVQLNYDELATIVKKFNHEGDDFAELYSVTRQKVQALTKEWIGVGADKFFDEMEQELLPALQRVSKALFVSQDALMEITKIIREADEENENLIKGSLGSGDDFGASGFEAAVGGLTGSGAGTGASGGDDFGASGFESAGGSVGGGTSTDDFGASTFESTLNPPPASELHAVTADFTEGGDLPTQEEMEEIREEAKETPQPGGGGGGGGGGGSSQGLQGDLKNMGVGLVDSTPQAASVGSGAAQDLPDHLFGGGSSGAGGSDSQPAAPGGGSGGGEPAQGSESGVAAGVAGVAGSAAVGAALKAAKDARDSGDS